jgi:histidinol-phosphate aminotransferase
VSRAEFEDFLEDLPKDQLVLVLDEAYREYVSEPDCPDGIDYVRAGQPVIVLRTFSKIYGLAGLRVGYGFAQPWLVELLNRVRPPFNVNSLAQVAALAALGDHEHLERSLSAVRGGMVYLTQQLSRLGFEVIPSEANFVTFCAKSDAKALYQALLREGLIVRHLASFGMQKCIRVTVGKDDENRRFIEALNRVLSDQPVER